MTAAWPDREEIPVDGDAAIVFEALQSAVERLRNLRAELGVQSLEVEADEGLTPELLSLLATYTRGSVKTSSRSGPEQTPQSLVSLLAGVRGVAPPDVLAARYKKEAIRLRAEVDRGQAKLSNEKFVTNANPSVVEKEREKLNGYREQLARVQAALEEMGVSG